MKSAILLLAFAAVAFSNCTTAYKTGQTPDDVYYSPARPIDRDEYVRVDDDDDREYRYDEYYYDDRYIRMKVQNRTRWSELDDWYYFDRYRYSYYNSSYWGNPWSPNVYWNNYYNPYCHNYIILNPKSNYSASRPRTFNLNTYNNNLLSNKGYTTTTGTNIKTTNVKINTGSGSYNNSGNNSSRGSAIRDIFNGGSRSSSSGSSSNNNSSSQPRTSSSSSSSSSSGSSGSSAPVRKF
jgi:hypothetical protein